MAVHVNLDDLGTPLLDKLLSEELLKRAADAQVRMEHALSAKVCELCQHGCKRVYIVRWREANANTFRWVGQIFEPGMEQEARALAAEKQGEIEIVDFEGAIPDGPPGEFLLDAKTEI